MGTGHRHGRPDGRAEAVSACAQLVESVRVGDAGAFTAAVDRWCAAVLADDEGWALWLWRGHPGFEARGHGGHIPPPRSAVDSVTHALESDALRSELATGHPVALDATVTGPEAVAAAVAFGSPAGLLAVLVVFRQAGRAAIDSVDLGLLAAAARLCTTAPLPPVAATSGVDVQPGLLADLRDALAAIVGFAHTLIHSEHRLGRVERHRYHTVIEREALALAGTIDDVSVVAGPPGEVAHPHVLTPGDRDAFAAELAARLGADADVTVSADLPADLPAVADARALALVLAGLAVAVAP
ncbi:MAG: hypothetical protein K1X95_15310, partial [Acidimicrobiia bacterium]|nr:hypothetical protein [Acidimicrobiia bacterium]